MAEVVSRPASSVDYTEMLESLMPSSEKPYILARIALADHNDDTVRGAIFALDRAHTDGVLEPPLASRLASEISYMAEEIDADTRGADNRANRFLLAWALDNQVRGMSRG